MEYDPWEKVVNFTVRLYSFVNLKSKEKVVKEKGIFLKKLKISLSDKPEWGRLRLQKERVQPPFIRNNYK